MLALHSTYNKHVQSNQSLSFSIAGSPIPPRPSDSVRARGRMETTRASPSIADDENLITSTHSKLSRDMFEGLSPEANHTVSPTSATYAGILAVLNSSSISLTREVVPSLSTCYRITLMHFSLSFLMPHLSHVDREESPGGMSHCRSVSHATSLVTTQLC